MDIDEKILGKKFGKLTPHKRATPTTTPAGRSMPRWHCTCDCGNQTVVMQHRMLSGKTRSCGCMVKEYRLRLHAEAAAAPKQPDSGKKKYRDRATAAYRAAGPGNLVTTLGVQKARQRNKKYGLEPHEYLVLLAQQNGACAICGEPHGGRDLDVDHDHSTGNVRGLLCSRCNKGLGMFKDSLQSLAAAINYLVKNSTAQQPNG